MIDDTNEGSLLMSESLLGELDLEADEKQILQDRSCIVVIKTKVNSQNDMLLGHLYSIGVDSINKIFNIELGIKQSIGLDFLDAFWNNHATIHGIDLHRGTNVVSLFKESDKAYGCIKCNVFDVSVQNEECTLTLSLTK